MTAADVNGDGKPDLIVANANSNTVSVLLNTTAPGATTPSFAAQQTFATGSHPVLRDGGGRQRRRQARPDRRELQLEHGVGAAEHDGAGATTPSFAAQQTFATGSCPRSVTAADVNGDGKPDLIVANDSSNTVSVLLNTTAPGAATPSFAAQQTFATGSDPFSVTAADVNGDGKPDLIVANCTLEHGVGAAEHDGARGHHPLLRRPADLRHRQLPQLRDGGGRERRRQARPGRRQRQLEHGVGAAEHDGARGHHPLLRRPADLRHRQRSRTP